MGMSSLMKDRIPPPMFFLSSLMASLKPSKESSCQGEDFSSKTSKENLSLELAINFTNLQNENKMLRDLLDTQSKHGNKIQNIKRQFKCSLKTIPN